MARWCRKPIDVGPGNVFSPLVIGPASVRVVDDVTAAERDPELAVLSCIVHGNEAHAELLGRAALLATLRLSDERQVLYSDLVFAALSEAARAALEDRPGRTSAWAIARRQAERPAWQVGLRLAESREVEPSWQVDAAGCRTTRSLAHPPAEPPRHERHRAFDSPETERTSEKAVPNASGFRRDRGPAVATDRAVHLPQSPAERREAAQTYLTSEAL
jgi:hypothetical protein